MAWIVVIEPSLPVVIAVSTGMASLPERISPQINRFGDIRNACLQSSANVTSPTPSTFGSRVSSDTTSGCRTGCFKFSSAASSTTTSRSVARDLHRTSARMNVVLPEFVPPPITTFSSARTTAARKSAA